MLLPIVLILITTIRCNFCYEYDLPDVPIRQFVVNITYCQMKNLSTEILMDGVMNVDLSERVYDECPFFSDIEILLLFPRFIYYIVIYEGTHLQNKSTDGLDYFMITMARKNNMFSHCAIYPKKSIGPTGEGMRVNCKFEMADRIRIISAYNHGFSICEIEIVTRGNFLPYSIFNGCFKTFYSLRRTSFVNILSCIIHCSKEYIMATVDTEYCICGMIHYTYERLPLKYCNLLTGDRLNNLGGKGYFALYVVNTQLPYHITCAKYMDKLGEAYYRKENMTVIDCLSLCASYAYAGIMGGNTCICSGIDSQRHINERGACNIPCPGDKESICGGTDHVSVYGSQSIYRRSIIDLLIEGCDSSLNAYGECPGKCKDGFYGKYCLETFPANSCERHNPCLNLTNTKCEIIENDFKCPCKPFYYLSGVNASCERHMLYYAYEQYSKSFLYLSIFLILGILLVCWIKSSMNPDDESDSASSTTTNRKTSGYTDYNVRTTRIKTMTTVIDDDE